MMPDVPTTIPAERNMTAHLWAKIVDFCLPKIDNDIKFIVKQITSPLMYKKVFMIFFFFYDSMPIFEIYSHLRQIYKTRARIAFHFHLLSLDIQVLNPDMARERHKKLARKLEYRMRLTKERR
jgi:hypothetical protein